MITLNFKDIMLLTIFLSQARDHFLKESSSPTLDEPNRDAAKNFADEAERLSAKFEDVLHQADDTDLLP